MGCVRTLLAVSVVLIHAYGFVFVGGIVAVQLFYVVSGFLISFVLIEARHYETVGDFYENRFLRIYPIYAVVALFTLAMYLVAGGLFGIEAPFVEAFHSLGPVAKLSLIVTNITVLGQDLILFTGVRDGTFQFVSDYNQSEVIVWHGLVVPQAWTLGVEMSFYILAPFVLPRMRVILVLLGLSLTLRTALYLSGFGSTGNAWEYRFFPNELALFLLGALAHQVWRPLLLRKGWLTPRVALVVTALILLYCASYFLLPARPFHRFAIIAAFVLALPFLFEFQRLHRWDRAIGDLSYPIYISHMAMIVPINFVFARWSGEPGYKGLDETAAILIATIVASVALNRFVGDPVERLRDRVRSRRGKDAAGIRLRLAPG